MDLLIMRTMLILPTNKLFINRVTGNPISRSKYTTMMHKEMQKMGIPTFFTAYSLKHAAIEKLVKNGIT
jgi:site-specific recombinase XerD